MSRPLAALASVILMGLSLLVLLPDCASACSCALLDSKKQVEWALSHPGAVFSGEVVKIDRPSSIKSSSAPETVTFRVSESWKGPEKASLEVRTPVSGMSCGYPFEEGQDYLVYAYGKQDLKVDLCSGTKSLSKAGAELALLGNGEKLKHGADALNDTSGVVPARAVLGLLGLAMAASLLVMVRVVRSG
jgi:hypothetical protein